MTIFAIAGAGGPLEPDLRTAIEKMPESQHLAVSDHLWLIAGTGTAKEIADTLGISDGTRGSAIVMEVASYWGRATPNVWSWIKANWEATASG